ncbi:TetR/AcrR family transcriptional regulator [Ferrimonas lipolytica]|uniref:TetR/AcrR family transcriptional regulator n=1 Tax=Ferrimonas lipolytica TaxID=2724191 RepID=A0A6H1UDC0_9GAMM|nr:TetR/AcrR family transcriptional regulator [Ferrimonas lipolytica]QIZ76343.1 TetR/AcrR family transcriptional regulator [Ferrimonas lipolytica]
MTAKKSGRQSAESANQTRDNIVCAAAELFSRKGFNAVSIREIADEVGVSHGLIRHHFGNKLQIWIKICEFILDDVYQELEFVLNNLDPALAPNQRFFTLITTLQASHINDPKMMKLMADGFRGDDERFALFRELPQQIEALFEKELIKVQQQGYLKGMLASEVKWMMCIFAEAPALLEPMMRDTYASDLEQARLQHWRLVCRMVAAMLDIDMEQLPKVNSLSQVATPPIKYRSCSAC